MFLSPRVYVDIAYRNPTTFRIWSPDELVSNKLDATLRDRGRNFQWDAASRKKGARIIETLSEHTCQGMLQGYTLTGRTGVFPSYEAFLAIIHTMVCAIFFTKNVRLIRLYRWCNTANLLRWYDPFVFVI